MSNVAHVHNTHTAHRWKFYLTSAEAWDGMILACEQAKTSIDFEAFIFEPDIQGERFFEVLGRKAKEGVRVRVLCDMVGSLFLLGSPLVGRLQTAGVEFKFFHPIKPWRFLRYKMWFFRDHRKLVVIDRHIGFTGGVCIGESFRDWRDTQVRVEGEVVTQMQDAFDYMWWIADRPKIARFRDYLQTHDGFSIITNAPHLRQRFINRTFIDMIRHAKKYIYITTPYFVPDRKFFRVLRLASRRGVEVRLLLPEKSDHPYVDLASNAHFRRAFASGIKIYRYPTVMLHAKTMVIDDEWASVGSANIDNLSSSFNYELNLTSTDKYFTEEVKGHFITDIAKSIEVNAKAWVHRSLYVRILEHLCSPFGRFF